MKRFNQFNPFLFFGEKLTSSVFCTFYDEYLLKLGYKIEYIGNAIN